MNLFEKLNEDEKFMEYFCDNLEELISDKKGYRVNIAFKKSDSAIYFFIDGSSILQVMPDKDLQYTYANVPSFQKEISRTLSIVEKQLTRDSKINQIIKKES